MMPVETAFGFIGAFFFLALIYYSRKSLQHFREHRDISLVKFQIDNRGERAFQILTGVCFAYAIAMVVTGMEFYYGSFTLLVASRGLILGVVVMLLYFMRELYKVTKKNPDE